MQYAVHIILECAPGAYMRIVGDRKFPRLFLQKATPAFPCFLVGQTVKPHSFLFLPAAHGSKTHSSILLNVKHIFLGGEQPRVVWPPAGGVVVRRGGGLLPISGKHRCVGGGGGEKKRGLTSA